MASRGYCTERHAQDTGYILPLEEQATIERRAAAGRLIQRSRYQDLLGILAAFNTAGFEPVILKGPILAERLYGDASLRFSSDLDILIDPDDLKSGVEGASLFGVFAAQQSN